MLSARRKYVSARRRTHTGGGSASCAIPPYHRRRSAPALPQFHRAEPAQAELLVGGLPELGGLERDGRELVAARVGERAAHDLGGEALPSGARHGRHERDAAAPA